MRFEVRALKTGGGVVALAVDAPDEASACSIARAQGLAVLSARRRRTIGWQPFAYRFPLGLFSQELVALLEAGLSLPEGMETMVEKESRGEARAILSGVRDRLFEGQSFSRALEAFPQVFPTLYVATVRASERSGDLAEALRRYIAYQERLEHVKHKIISASIYPAVLLMVGGFVTLFLLGYVVPRFSSIYATSGRDLPWLSRLLLEWGELINRHGMKIFAASAIAVIGCVLLVAQIRSTVLRLLGYIPAIGTRILVYHLARLYRTVGMLLRGGTPIVAALGMVTGLLPVNLQGQLDRARQRIRDGASISVAMAATGLVTPVASRMLRVGERSGEMAEMMDRIAVFHDEELARWVDWFSRLVEPLLMVLIGLVIGVVVVLMYLPIFELAGTLS